MTLSSIRAPQPGLLTAAALLVLAIGCGGRSGLDLPGAFTPPRSDASSPRGDQSDAADAGHTPADAGLPPADANDAGPAPADASSTTTFVSGPDWASYAGTLSMSPVTYSLGQLLGPAREVCPNASEPTNCPSGALLYGFVGTGSPVWEGSDSVPDAHWVWRADVTPGASSIGQVAIVQKTFQVGPNPTGSVHLCADDFAAFFVNGSAVGTVGSVTDIGAALTSQDQGATFDLGSALHEGENTLTAIGQNGPWGCASTMACPYSENTAGIVFEGTLSW